MVIRTLNVVFERRCPFFLTVEGSTKCPISILKLKGTLNMPFETHAIVEIMGHVRIAGKVSEQVIAGAAMLRVDVPKTTKREPFTKFYGANAIYSITPTDEETANRAAEHFDETPVQPYILRLPESSELRGRIIHGDDSDFENTDAYEDSEWDDDDADEYDDYDPMYNPEDDADRARDTADFQLKVQSELNKYQPPAQDNTNSATPDDIPF